MVLSGGRKVPQDHDHRLGPPHGPGDGGHSLEVGEEIGAPLGEGVGADEHGGRWRSGSHESDDSPLHNLR